MLALMIAQQVCGMHDRASHPMVRAHLVLLTTRPFVPRNVTAVVEFRLHTLHCPALYLRDAVVAEVSQTQFHIICTMPLRNNFQRNVHSCS